MNTGFKLIKSFFKVLVWVFTIFSLILVALGLIIKIPKVQELVKEQAESAISEGTGIESHIGHLSFNYPAVIELDDVLFNNNLNDSILYASRVKISVGIFPLVKRKIVVRNFELNGAIGDLSKVISAFSSGSKEKEDPKEAENNRDKKEDQWEVKVKKLNITNTHLVLRDENSGYDLDMIIGDLTLGLGDINNEENEILVKELSLSKTKVSLDLFQGLDSLEIDTSESSFDYIIYSKLTSLDEVEFSLADESGFYMDVKSEALEIQNCSVDVFNTSVSSKSILIENTLCQMQLNDTIQKKDTSSIEVFDLRDDMWDIKGEDLTIHNSGFLYNVINQYEQNYGFNPNHIDLRNGNIIISDYSINGYEQMVDIDQFSFEEEHGFKLKSLAAQIKNENGISDVSKLNLETENSALSIDFLAPFNPFFIQPMPEGPVQFELNVNLTQLNDLYYFYPNLDSIHSINEDLINSPISLKLTIEGSEEDFDIKNLDIDMLDSTSISLIGKIKNITRPSDIEADIKNISIVSSRNDLKRLIPLEDSLNLSFIPEFLDLKGQFFGGTLYQDFSGNIKSNFGEIEILDISIDRNDLDEYSADLVFNLSELSKINAIGIESLNTTLKANYQGKGETVSLASLAMEVSNLTYQGYTIKGVSLNGELENEAFGMKVLSKDEHFNFDLLSSGRIQKNEKYISTDININNAELDVLTSVKESLKFNGKGKIDFSLREEDFIAFESQIESLNLFIEDSLYKIDPIDLSLETDRNHTLLDINSAPLEINFTIASNIDRLKNDLSGLVEHYLSCNPSVKEQIPMPDFNLNLEFENQEYVKKLFIPSSYDLKKIALNSSYSEYMDQLKLELELIGLSNQSINTDTIQFNLKGNSTKMEYKLRSDIELNNKLNGLVALYGDIACATLTANFSYKDSYNEEVIYLSSLFEKKKENYSISLNSDSLIFVYDNWNIDPMNQIEINENSIIFDKFQLKREDQELRFENLNNTDDFRLAVTQFKMGRFQQFLSHDTIIEGVVDAEFDFINFKNDFSIKGELLINDLKIHGAEIGKTHLRSVNINKDKVFADLGISGENIDLSLVGTYRMDNEKDNINAKLNLQKLEIDELNYILKDNIYDAQGELKGEIDIKGNVSDPILNGNIVFKDAAIGVVYLNEVFRIGNERIVLLDNLMKFDAFTINNQQNEAIRVNGSINLGKKEQYYSDLNVSIDPIELMNTSKHEKEKNELIYGLIRTQGNIHINGMPDDLSINPLIKINKETNITYTFPENLSVADNDGLVRFISTNSDSLKKFNTPEHPFFTFDSFKTVNTKIEIQKGTKLKLFFQETSKNNLDASLSGSLNYHLKNEVSQVSGRISIDDGELLYTLPMTTANKYKIEQGSYINIADELYNPEIHLKASTTVRASTETLMANYKKVMGFTVFLIMDGELDDIHISFDIDTDTNDPIVSAKLSQLTAKERNINALNLLIRGAFILSLGGPDEGSASILNSQIDKLSAQVLNQLVSENIDFVDLKFDVQSYKDYSESGEDANIRKYYYNVGKSFLHNRARVTYTGSIDVLDREENVNASFEQSHLEAEIKLDKKGTYNALLFRKNNYEGLLEGEIIATGGGFRIKKNYYSFRDIFIFNKNKDAKEKKNKEK